MAKIKCACEKCQVRFEVESHDEIQEIGKKLRDCSRGSFRVIKICENCNKEFFIPVSWDKKSNYKTCSDECRNYLYSLCYVEKECLNCGKVIKKKKSGIKNNKNVFCDQKCKIEFETKKIECQCLSCDTVFYKRPSEIKKGEGNYCSWECRYTPRELIIKDDHALVPLTQNKFAIIDLEDVERVKKYNWKYVKKHGLEYANRTNRDKNGQKTIALHRFILNVIDDKVIIDHKDRFGLNCRKYNLRICNDSQNCQNRKLLENCSSKYKGVVKKGNKWIVRIGGHKNREWLGSFDDEIEAAKVYDRRAIELFKEFARTNFPKENYN